VADVVPHLEEIDDVMLMSIRPGWSGQTLHPEVLPRLESVRTEVDRRGLAVDVEVDGGVKVENARSLVDAGASVLIAASGIFQAPDPAGAARELAAVVRQVA
jgi:ribulose-phosphate 3-epimerase